MPILETITKITIKNNRQYKKIYAKCICDNCNLEWEAKRWNKNNNYIFCSQKCSIESRKKGNFLDELSKKRNYEKYGCEYPLQNEEIYSKRQNSILEKYGVENIQETNEWKNKRKESIILKFGKEFFDTDEFKEKRKNKLLDKYGVDSPIKNIEILKKRKNTNLQKYGGEPLKNKIILNKMFETNIEKYGYKTSFSLEEVQKKCYLRIHGYTRDEYLERIDEYNVYRAEVRKITEEQNLSVLEFYEYRGKKTYHLDHIYSISEGFKNKIKPEIIGNIINLRFIPAAINLQKTNKCDISLEELIRRFNELPK